MSGFTFKRSLSGASTDANVRHRLGASLSVVKGEALNLAGNLLAKATATGKVTHIAQEAKTTTSTQQSMMDVLPVSPDMVFEQSFTPLYDDDTATSGSTTTAVFDCGVSGNNDDINGGLIHCVELNETRVITDSSYSSQVVTVTVTEPFSRAIAAGDTLRVCAPAEGNIAHQLDGSSPSLLVGQAVDDDSSGNVTIRKIDLENKKIEVSFNQ